jgi:hypothetical protein
MDPDRKPLCERTLRGYLAEPRKRFSAMCRQEETEALYLHIAQRRGLYARAMAAEDYRTALAVHQDLAQLADLYPAPKQQAIEVHGVARLEIIEELVEMPTEAAPPAA